MPSGGVETPIPASVFARLAAATRFVISGAGPDSWFGPQQPLAPQAPGEVKGRQWDYPFGVNINYTPRADSALSFAELRLLSEALPLLRTVIETRKDQIAALNWTVRPRLTGGASAGASARCDAVRGFLATPDRRHDFATWIRMLVEDMLVIDAACVYPRYARSGSLFSLDVVDGATIKPLIGEDGRSPAPPDPAYQQVLHGVPAADFGSDELLYLPRNVRSHRLYGLSPVEQIALTVNIALRREQATLDYYHTGSIPDSFATLPKEWTVDQIRQFQDYFDALMSGNLARRRMVKFMPAEFRLTETRQPPLKDQYDEWLARVICYAFSVPASAFITQVNRATSETLRAQAATEGLVPLKAWVKMALDRAIAVGFGEPDLEFYWVGDDAVDPLQQAQTISILVGAGVKSIAEARAELGLGGAKGVVKYNHYHDEQGRFTDAEGAVEPGTDAKPRNGATGSSTAGAKPNATTALSAAPIASRAYHAAMQAANEVITAAGETGASLSGRLVGGIVTATAATSALAAAALLAMTKSTGGVQQGSVPGRPDITYRWALDETTATFTVESNGQTQTLRAQQNSSGDFVDAQGNVIATVESGQDGQSSLLVDSDAVDAAIAAAAGSGSAPASSGGESSADAQVQYYNPETGDVISAHAGAAPPGYVPVSGVAANQVGVPSGGQSGQPSPSSNGALSNAGNAIISPDKILGYSLNPNNPRGGNKAVVFDSALGYNQSNASALIEAIRNGVTENPASFFSADQFGPQYRVDMSITGPNGNTRIVRTGWIYDPSSDRPRLVTAYILH